MDERLEVMCASWLIEKFGREAAITELKVEEQEEIDRLLNLVVVKFSFIDEEGNEGEGAAFFNADAVRQRVQPRIQKVGGPWYEGKPLFRVLWLCRGAGASRSSPRFPSLVQQHQD